jgi:GTP-binding protein Era
MNEPEGVFHTGFVAVVGRPNVGKSTLLNNILGQKVAAVSPKPQTTRKQQLGILTLETAQVVFVDTPGMHISKHKLGDFMNMVAENALLDGDLILWIVDASFMPTQEDRLIAERINRLQPRPPVFLVLNKSDLISEDQRLLRPAQYLELVPEMDCMFTCADQNIGVQELLQRIIEKLPEGPAYYDEDQVTDLYERDIAVELIREAVLLNLSDEVPHAVGVRLDDYEDRGEDKAYMMATLFVERESQKGIVIGKKGSMIKEIGTTARKEIEEMTGRQVFLDLRVKVHKNWRNNPDALNIMGYRIED